MDMFQHLLLLSGIKKAWPQLTEEDVRHHNTARSLWIVSGNSVYDVTHVLRAHPGGEAALLRRGGGLRDCTEDFAFHSRYARRVWEDCKVGELAPGEREKLFLYLPPPTTTTTSYTDAHSNGSSLPPRCGVAEAEGGSSRPSPTRSSALSSSSSGLAAAAAAPEEEGEAEMVAVRPSCTTTLTGKKGTVCGRCAHCGR